MARLLPLPHPDGTAAVLRCWYAGDLLLRLDPSLRPVAVHVSLEARLLPDRPYRTEAFLAAMAHADAVILECRAHRD